MAYDVGVIVLNYNSFGDVKNCVDSIKETASVSYHIYVVDNMSTDDSRQKLQEKYSGDKDVSIVLSPVNGGYSAGNNYGAKYAVKDGCKYLLISNTDILYKENAINEMVQVFENPQYQDVAVCGPRIESTLSDDAEEARAKWTFTSFLLNKKPFYSLGLGKYSKRLIPIEYDENGVFCFEGMVSGCSFVIRADEFESISGFDEKVFLFGEEDIIAYKLAEKKRKSALVEKANIFHNHSKTINARGSAFSKYYAWLSPMYVLKNYVKINKAQAIFLYLSNMVVWYTYSLRWEDFRKLTKKFRQDNKRFLGL